MIATPATRGPDSQVSAEDPKYVVPGPARRSASDEEYVVLLNDRNVPRLRISSAYEGVHRREQARSPTHGAAKQQTREYIQGKLNSAKLADPDHRAAPPHA